jgi:DNA-binding winged helix-turn-helix (wHTH) protein
MATLVKSDHSSNEQPLRVRFDRFDLDERNAQLLRDGKAIPLAPTPFAVLCALARKPKSLLTTNALLDEVWGHQYVTDSVLRTAISELRTVLDDDARKPRFIETVSRRGYRFIANPSASASLPGTAQSSCFAETQSSAWTLIGRSNEVESLRSAWQQAAAGKRQLIWIAGEAGVGKTTLIERFVAEVGEAHCAHGNCVDQHGAGEPYLAVLEALTALCRRDAALPELIRAVAPSWLLRLPWLSSAAERDSLRGELAGAGEARMLREMGELLDRYTHDRPLLLVTEDLHWSDHATVQLMNYVARRRGSGRLLWLASFRLTELIAADHPFNSVRRELRLHGVSKEIVLDAFSEVEVAKFLGQRVPALACDEAFVRALHDRTDGLPLFVSAVVDGLAADATPAALHRAWTIPDAFTGIVERYVAELTPGQRLVLEAASMCGAEFRVATVAHVLGADAAFVAETCAELARRQRWLKDAPLAGYGLTTDAHYAFRHALYRQVLYKRIGQLARDELRRKVADCLARDGNETRDVAASGGSRKPRRTASRCSMQLVTAREHAAA